MNLKLIITLSLITLTASADTLMKGAHISFMSPTTKIMTEGIVKKSLEQHILFEAKEFIVEPGSATYIAYRNYQATDKDVGTEVSELYGFSAGMNACFQNKKAQIERLYSNDTAKIIHGDIFGKRFLLFQRPQIVKISELSFCE